MGRRDTWMPVDVGAYLADTMRLTTQQHGAYFLLLLDYWKSGPLPDDDEQLAGVAKVDLREWKAKVGPVVRRFFAVADDGLLHQKRADAEIEKSGRISNARRDAALERHNRPARPPPNEEQDASKTDANTHANAHANHLANGMQNPRAYAVAPPLPRTLQPGLSPSQSSRETGNGHEPSIFSHLEGVNPDGTLDRSHPKFNGPDPDTGREMVGGWYWDEVWPRILEATGLNPVSFLGTEIEARKWLREGLEPDQIVAGIERRASRGKLPIIRSLGFFDKAVRETAGRAA